MRERIQVLFGFFVVLLIGIVVKLFYWQVVNAGELEKAATDQHTARTTISAKRGEISAEDGFPLVFNEPRYALNVYTPNITLPPSEITDIIMSYATFEVNDLAITTSSAKLKDELERITKDTKSDILEKLTTRTWAPLLRSLSIEQKEAIESHKIIGLEFDEFFVRNYPEASMSAHVLGFVGRDDIGNPIGYFGLEGFYDRELRGAEGLLQQEKDAQGRPLLTVNYRKLEGRNGRNLDLHLDRAMQFIAESQLKQALARYGASSGEVVIMDPRTGGILAMSALPAYDPVKYWLYETVLYKNPIIANTYEPGSTFKVLTMAAALEEDAVKLDDKCDICGGPVSVGKYTIKTWDGNYEEGRTPVEIIVNSDNTGMVWTQKKLGGEKLVEYIEKFGFGSKTGVDLQEEVTAPLRSRWGEIDYTTSSFGQGLAVTSIQMVSAVGAIANGGLLMEPHVVKQVVSDRIQPIEPKIVRRVISKETADIMTDIMVKAVDEGEAKWTRVGGYEIAGKTGTAQIAVAGHYDTEKTIASFVGFAPADDPVFVMLVKLKEPTSSPWGSETAAPLWFDIARKLLIHLDVPPTE